MLFIIFQPISPPMVKIEESIFRRPPIFDPSPSPIINEHSLKENALSTNHFSCNLYRLQLCTDWTIPVKCTCDLQNKGGTSKVWQILLRAFCITIFYYKGPFINYNLQGRQIRRVNTSIFSIHSYANHAKIIAPPHQHA